MSRDDFSGGQSIITVKGLWLIFEALCLLIELKIYSLPADSTLSKEKKEVFMNRLKELKE